MNKTLITSPEKFQEWYQNNWRPEMSIDFETTSLDYMEMEFVGFSLCNGEECCYVNFLVEIPRIQKTLWIMHRSVYDLKCFYKFFGYTPKNIFCSLVGAKLVNENLNSYSLKNLAQEWLGIPANAIKQWEEVSDNVNSEEFYRYAQNDAIWTYQLYLIEKEEFKRQGLEHIAYDVEFPFQFVLRDMEMNGVFVNKDKLEEYRDECKEILRNIEECMLAIFGRTHNITTNLFGEVEYESPINFSSSQQLVHYIELLRMVITERTKPSKTHPRGQKSVDKNTLKRLKGNEFIDLLIRYRKLSTMYNTFLEPCEGYMSSDNRIRPSYNLVRTGRLSCSGPNLQNQPNPKKEKLEFNYRKIFIPKPGHVLVKADYSGQELRVLAEVSKDDNMVAAFNKNYDLHLFTANRVFNLDLPDEAFIDNTEAHTKAVEKYKRKRHQAKNGVNFPTVYGAYAKRIGQDNDVSTKEAQRWLDEFNNLYPKVKKAIELTKKELKAKGYVTTLMGRRRRFPYYNSAGKFDKGKMERQAFNFKVQGFSADMAKVAAWKILPYLPLYQAKIVLAVHDEFVFEVPEEKAESFAAQVKSIMEGCVVLSIPILVDVSIVESYGD